jgi:bifunctional non-homologous end joining protein LigD
MASSECPTTIRFRVEVPTVRRGSHWFARAGSIELRLSNLDKTFWPETGYTKGDLLTYYFNVSPVMVPHLRDRPLTLRRMPDGVAGAYFYEKDAPSYTPDWMPTIDVPLETEDRTVRALTVRDVASLLWVANLGCIDFHPLHATGARQTHPSYAVFDLDPFPPARFDDACEAALLLKAVLDRLGLDAYPKTSGGTGLHVYMPLDETHSFDDVRTFVGAVCGIVHRAAPDLTTMEWDVSKRSGKVFLDYGMNRAQASLSCAYSVRPEWNAPVSTPLAWGELDDVDPAEFTMASLLDRVDEVGDLFSPVLQPPGEAATRAINDVLKAAGRD